MSIWLPFLKFYYIFSIYYGHVAVQFSPWHKLDLIRLVVRLKRVSSDSLILHRLKIKHWMPWASQAYSSTCMFHFHKKVGMSVVERKLCTRTDNAAILDAVWSCNTIHYHVCTYSIFSFSTSSSSFCIWTTAKLLGLYLHIWPLY